MIVEFVVIGIWLSLFIVGNETRVVDFLGIIEYSFAIARSLFWLCLSYCYTNFELSD